MSQTIILTENDNQITARSLIFPEVVITGTDEALVLNQIRKKLNALLQNSRLIQLDLTPAHDPWLQFVGMWANDKNWDIFLEEVETYRRSFDSPAS